MNKKALSRITHGVIPFLKTRVCGQIKHFQDAFHAKLNIKHNYITVLTPEKTQMCVTFEKIRVKIMNGSTLDGNTANSLKR